MKWSSYLPKHIETLQSKDLWKAIFYYLFFPWFWFVILAPGFLVSIPAVAGCEDGVKKPFAPGRTTIVSTLIHAFLWAFLIGIFYFLGAKSGIAFPFTNLAHAPGIAHAGISTSGENMMLQSWFVYAVLPILAFIILSPGLVFSLPPVTYCDDHSKTGVIATKRVTALTTFVHSLAFITLLALIFALGSSLHLTHPVTSTALFSHMSKIKSYTF